MSILIFDYRGYGRSRGKPSEQGIYPDTGAAWDYLVTVMDKKTGNITASLMDGGCKMLDTVLLLW